MIKTQQGQADEPINEGCNRPTVELACLADLKKVVLVWQMKNVK